jgi:hypothetical protein
VGPILPATYIVGFAFDLSRGAYGISSAGIEYQLGHRTI